VTGVDGSDAADGRLVDGEGPDAGEAGLADAVAVAVGEAAVGEVVTGFDGPPDEPCAPLLGEQAHSGRSAVAARRANERMTQCGRYRRVMPVVSLPDTEWIEMVGPVAGIEAVPWDIVAEPPRRDEIELVVPPYIGDREPLRRLAMLPSLRAVQLLTAGYDDVLPLLPPGVTLANAAGVHDASTAELAVGLALAVLRGVPDMVRAQDRARWVPLSGRPALADKRVLILGYGSIGRAVARRLTGFEVTLTAVASQARAGDDLVPRVHGIDELPGLLPHHDVVVVIVPLSPATTGLVDRDFLAAMPDGALLVNVARGKVVDTDALVEATAIGRIMAALDVTDPEPLPDDHPLWRSPGVLVSPHVGGDTSAFAPRAVALVREQLTSLLRGEPLRNVVGTGETVRADGDAVRAT